MLMSLLLLVACDGKSVEVDSSPLELAPLPELLGPLVAEDLEPHPSVVEIELSAAVTSAQYLEEGVTEDVWAYNGQVPGPVIQARVGDTLRVVFTNDLPESTTIHWHGLRIPDDMDGVPAIQDPVEPGETFVYEFTLPDAGTYWYHPHVRSNEQIERGLQGMLIVHEAEPIIVDAERVFTIDDIALNSSGAMYEFDLDNSHSQQVHGRLGNTLLVNGETDLLTGTSRPEGVERWRMVNTANGRTMYVSVSGARWRVIGVDGGLIPAPYEAERVLLPVGRRFDLEVIPTADGEGPTLNVELASGDEFSVFPVFQATLEGSMGDGESPEWSPEPLEEIQEALQEVELTLDVEGGGTSIDWTINGVTYGEHEPIVVQGNTPTLIRVRERSRAEHPFHLHGNFFRVLTVDGQAPDGDGRFDSWLINGAETVQLYTMLENPGRWMSHCHILEHAERGMMAELVVEE
ncbi:MAG: multicopper oxidase family protein [Alphaproteobacteria bacterium]|nr:multicopper oxidase family protein [Alphaproteobacteria bacterium]